MRALVWFLGLGALAIGLVLFLLYDDGYVLVVMHPWRIELSLNLALILLMASFVASYSLFRVAGHILRLPESVAAFRERRRRESAAEALQEAVANLFAGRYGRALKAANVAWAAEYAPGVAAVVGLRAAARLRDPEREREWRERARRYDQETGAARLMSEAEIALDSRRYSDARDALQRLEASDGRHIAALRLSLRTEQAQGHWNEVVRLTRQLQKHKALTADQATPLRRRAHVENLRAVSHDASHLLRYWLALPGSERADPGLALEAARLLTAAGDCVEAARIIEDALAEQWESSLVAAYGDCRGGDAVARIAHGEKWLVEHPRDAELLLVLGRLCRQRQLWGKAQSYLEASVAIEPSRKAHLELAGLLDHLERAGEANRHYRAAAAL